MPALDVLEYVSVRNLRTLGVGKVEVTLERHAGELFIFSVDAKRAKDYPIGASLRICREAT